MSTPLEVVSPYTREVLHELSLHDSHEIEQVLETAHQTCLDRSGWLPKHRRLEILERLAERMRQELPDLVQTMVREGGKPLKDSETEAQRALQGVQAAIHTLFTRHGQEIPMGQTARTQGRLAITTYEPRGPVLAVSAFNHPLNLIVHQVVPAIAVGAPVIVKPASATPMSCLAFVKLVHEAGLPEAWCQTVICENELTERMTIDDRIRYFSFIGSAKVGWYLKSRLARGVDCTLEHGGAAPVVLAEDADFDDAVPLLTKAGFYHAGQVCVSLQRAYVPTRQAETFAEKLAAQAAELTTGDPLKPETQVGPLIRPEEVDRVHRWVQEAVDKGARLLCGGQPLNETCYAPTVLLDPPDDVRISLDEVFGPVVCVYSCRSHDEAIQRANALPFTFQAAVFSRNLDTAFDTARRLKGMTVLINDHTAFRADWMPFGGSELSGMHLGGIPYTMADYCYEKQLIVRSPAFDWQ